MIDQTHAFRLPEASPWSAELNAMELGDFPVAGKSMWIAVGNANGIDPLRNAYPDTPMALLKHSGASYRVDLPPGDWRTAKLRSQEGIEPLPNIVYFPPEGRRPNPPGGEIKRLDL